MPRSYAPQFRAMVVDQVRSGRRVAEVSAALGLPEGTVFRWVRQDRIDRGELAGTPTAESAEIRAARRRIAELEAELATVKRASELFDKGSVVRPKDLFGIVVTLASEGHGTKRACRILGVAPSGFFRWRSMPPSRRAIRRAWLADVITEIHVRSRGTYGWRRIRAELADAYGQTVNKKLITAIMAERGITGLPKRRRPKASPTHRAITEDLVQRQFRRQGPDQLWMTDITEHPTREGKLYCCVVLDAWSRRVVGWSLDRRPTAAMVNSALGMAVEGRQPRAGTLIHSDTVRSSPLGRSASGSGQQTSRTPWARLATPSTTPWSSRSGPACRPSCSTAASGGPAPNCRRRSSTGSRSSTTGPVVIAPSGCSPRSPMKSSTPTTPAPPDFCKTGPMSGGQINPQ